MTTDEEIERIALALLDCRLPKRDWTHRAHFAAALWLLAHPAVLANEGGMAPIIRRYNEVTGVPNTDGGGYHETITLASQRGAAAFLPAPRGLGAALDALMASRLGDKAWPLTYWSEPRLMSVAARRCWVEPDLAPLPWPALAPDLRAGPAP